MHSFVKNERVQMLAVAIATAVGAAFKINPFSNDFFRVGLGVSTFLLFLLLMRHLSYIKTGIISGILAAAFQAGEWMLQTHSFSIMAAVHNNVAAGLYYVVFALAMSRLKKGIHVFQPLLLGGLISVIDFLSNVTELVLRGLLLGINTFHLDQWFFLLIVAVLRSYFVVGLCSSLSISQMRIVHIEQQKRMAQMLSINAGLYGEVFYLKKSMDTIESITVSSYFLYSKLKEDSLNDYGRQVLGLAHQIHEVKKDSQRILAGLLKLFDSEIVVDMNLSDVLHNVIKANQEYSDMLHKQIIIHKDVEINYYTSNYIPLLTLLNNLVCNAVEATVKEGTIHIHVFEQGQETCFVISDTGKGILDKNKHIIFEPGFTTKFNEKGIAATGIGLSHVRDIIQSFGGQIEVQSAGQGGGSRFIVHLPTARLKMNAEGSPT